MYKTIIRKSQGECHNKITQIKRKRKSLRTETKGFHNIAFHYYMFMLFILVSWDRSSFVCCLVHRGSTDDFLLLQISIDVVWQTRDLHLSRNMLYLLSPRLCFCVVFKRDLFVIDEFEGYSTNRTSNKMFYTTSETEEIRLGRKTSLSPPPQ